MNALKNRKSILIIIVAAGALLMLLGRFMFPGEREEPVDEPYMMQAPPPAPAPDIQSIEERLEDFFSLVEGAGKVRVMVGFTTERETVFAVDSNVNESFTREEDAQGGSRETQQNASQHQTVLIPDRNGGSRPLVLRESEPRVAGIVIIAEGGSVAQVRAELTRAAQALLGLEAHKIQVLTMRNE